MKSILLASLLLLASCATPHYQSVVSTTHDYHPKTAYFVPHKGKSKDMDANIQRALLEHGIAAQVGSDIQKTDDAEIIVKYSDTWRWDISMYLKSLDIEFFNAKTGALITQGSWENSRLHDYSHADQVVADVITEMFAKLGSTKK